MFASVMVLIDWFVPASAKGTRSDFGRARLFVFTHIFGPAIGTSIVVYLAVVDRGGWLQCSIVGTCIWSFWLLPFWLRRSGNLSLVAMASMQNLLFVTFFGAFFYGGMVSPFLPWLLVALLLGFSFCVDRPKTVTSIFLANVAIFAAVVVLNGLPTERIPLTRLQNVGLLSVFGATMYVAWMAIYFGRLLATESGLECEAALHRKTADLLLEAKDKAERANREKSAFLEKMSHELRTPLNAVLGYSEILLDDAEETDRESVRACDLRRVNKAGKHLLSLVTDVLDLSKIESDTMEIRGSPIALGVFLEEIAATVAPLIAEKHNRLILEIDAQSGEIVSDATRLRQIILNLLSNAAKFTHGGTISLSACRPGGTRGKWVEIAVRDEGIGISEADLATLFQDFSQVRLRQAKMEGTGLGLVVSRKLCTLMGGAITVDSQPGVGSRFCVRIPADIGAAPSLGGGTAPLAIPNLFPALS